MNINNIILKINVGSILYGTDTINSDTDISGIFIQPKESFFGFNQINEIDLSVVDKNELTSKNTKDAQDIKLYEIGKFLKLGINGNPNILEQIFVNNENILEINEYGKLILDNKLQFPHKKIVNKFIGYAKNQKHKMIIKTDNILSFYNAKEFLISVDQNIYKKISDLSNNKNCTTFMKFDDKFCYVGDIKLNLNISIHDGLKIINTRISKVGNRQSLILKHGYDNKFASHLIRLLMECLEILQTGKLEFPLSYAQDIVNIKNGDFKLEEILKWSEDLETKIKIEESKSQLQPKSNFDKIDKLLQEIRLDYYYKN